MAYEIKSLNEELDDIQSNLNSMGEVAQKENRNFTEEEIVRFDELDAKKADVAAKLATAERLEKVRGITRSKAPNIIVRSPKVVSGQNAFRAWLLDGSAGASHMVRNSWKDDAEALAYRSGSNQIIQRTDLGQDLTTGHGAETIDGDIFVGLMTRLKAYGGIRDVADVFTTENGNPIHYAFADDVSNTGSIVGENTGQTSVPVAYSSVSLSAFTYRSGVYPISWQLIQDARIDIVNDVARKLAIRIARRQNTDWTTGSGTGQPTGFLTALGATGNSGQIATTAASGAITYTDLSTLIHTVDPEYRKEEEGVCLMMNDGTAAYLEQNLLDKNNRPLWLGPGTYGNVSEAAPARIAIMGKSFPVIINQAMPAYTQTSLPCIAFGWFKSYKVRDVADLRIEVLRERYADLAAVGVQAYARSDGNLVDPNALAALKMHA